jgi:hypothetical protein
MVMTQHCMVRCLQLSSCKQMLETNLFPRVHELFVELVGDLDTRIPKL